MQNAVTKVAVVGSGISGAVCAATLARNGVSVTLFDSARGPGGRMSRRREMTEDGKELLFDHGAPYFTLTNPDAFSVVAEWELRGLVNEWKLNFGSFDCSSNKFVNIEHQETQSKKYVGVPGMNSICKALCTEPGVESKFNAGVGKFEWIEHENLWSLISFDDQNLGCFIGVVASDKNIGSPRFTEITGQSPPLDLSLAPELAKLHNIPVSPCFALMLAFSDPLSSVPVKGFSFTNSKVLSWAYCENSKPGRSSESERWVLHSTMEYAKDIIAQTGVQKPSKETLSEVGEEMLQEFLGTGSRKLIDGEVPSQLQAQQEKRNACGIRIRDWLSLEISVLVQMLKARFSAAWLQLQSSEACLVAYSKFSECFPNMSSWMQLQV